MVENAGNLEATENENCFKKLSKIAEILFKINIPFSWLRLVLEMHCVILAV